MGGALHVIGGADRGKRFDLTLAETRIGRGADQDVVLSDIAVSRRHITVHMEGPRFRLKDLGSGNGTLVNGQRIDTVLLNDGDHIELGNTVLRFNQQGAVAAVGPPTSMPQQAPFGPPPTVSSFGQPVPAFSPAPVAYSPPQPQGMLQNAPVIAPLPQPMPQPIPQPQMIGVPQPAPYSPATMSPSPAPPAMAMAAGPRASVPRMAPARRGSSGPLDSPVKVALVFGGMALVCALGVTVIVSRTVYAKPQVVPSEAEESYKSGLKFFAQADYDGAKVNFNDAASQAPDAPEPKRYLKQCEAELRARGALRGAERAQATRHYVEALRDLESVEEGTIAGDQAARMRKELGPRAAAEEVEDAKRAMMSDPSAAQQRLLHALELDPGNAEARALLPKIKGGKPLAMKEEAPPPPPAEHHHSSPKEPAVAVAKEPKAPPPGPSVSVGESKGAMGLYKNKDFAGAVRAARLESMSQTGKQLEKTQALVTQLKNVQAAFDRASAEEVRSPSEAVKDYNEAMSLDQKLSKGVHTAFFKQKIGKVQLTAAQQSFQQGKYDQAYSAVLLAQKYGAGDGGMLKQLETKANELVQKGVSIQKSNLNQAKSNWHMVCKMVPTSSPVYLKAYSLINNSSGNKPRDEDEN